MPKNSFEMFFTSRLSPATVPSHLEKSLSTVVTSQSANDTRNSRRVLPQPDNAICVRARRFPAKYRVTRTPTLRCTSGRASAFAVESREAQADRISLFHKKNNLQQKLANLRQILIFENLSIYCVKI